MSLNCIPTCRGQRVKFSGRGHVLVWERILRGLHVLAIGTTLAKGLGTSTSNKMHAMAVLRVLTLPRDGTTLLQKVS